ncbi:MAG: D-glycero-alpha-D-manno-heptose-1,7-bisphosphate 7-phosphatase [Agriterribacter sp.]
MIKAVFLDKDGTLVKDVPYNIDTNLVEFTAYAVEALQLLQQIGYKFIVVSNQSGIAKGYFSPVEVKRVFDYISAELALYEVIMDDFYYCPHFYPAKIPEFSTPCLCRKPRPGMLLQAAYDHNISLNESWMIGDILDDVEAGNRAGCRTILLNNGNETEWLPGEHRLPHFMAANLMEAATIISEHLNRDANGGMAAL